MILSVLYTSYRQLMRTDLQTMTKTFISLIILLFFISCKTGDSDIKLNSDTGDTLEIVKLYPSNKIQEIITYKNNVPFKNISFSDKGDTLKFPSLVHIVETKELFMSIPLEKKFVDVTILFTSEDTTIKQPIFKLEHLKKSTVIPIYKAMVDKNKVKGLIGCKALNGEFWYYPFQVGL